MTELKMEHFLILAIVIFVLYHFMGRCSCMCIRDGFSVGGDSAQDQQICKNNNGCQKLWSGFRCSNNPQDKDCDIPQELDQTYCNKPVECSMLWANLRSNIFKKNNYMY